MIKYMIVSLVPHAAGSYATEKGWKFHEWGYAKEPSKLRGLEKIEVHVLTKSFEGHHVELSRLREYLTSTQRTTGNTIIEV